MKKQLLVLALTLTGFISQAQMTRVAWSTWNLDTTGYASVTSAGAMNGDSKTLSIPNNYSLHIQVESAVRGTEVPAVNSVSLWGSFDNALWVRVPVTTSSLVAGAVAPQTSVGTAFVSRSNPYAIGTYPTYTQPSPGGTTAAMNSAVLVVAGDSISLGVTPVANTAILLNFSIPNPTFTYYKLTYYAVKAANTNATVFNYKARYYLRKAY
jgi:hypothetical protein